MSSVRLTAHLFSKAVTLQYGIPGRYAVFCVCAVLELGNLELRSWKLELEKNLKMNRKTVAIPGLL